MQRGEIYRSGEHDPDTQKNWGSVERLSSFVKVVLENPRQWDLNVAVRKAGE